MTGRGLRRSQVVELVVELERRLAEQGVVLDLKIVVGAALLLHGLIERATEDIDAEYSHSAIVDDVVAQMSHDYGLPKNWLNSHAAAFLPENVRWVLPPIGTFSAVKLADLPTLAAMKVAAEREKDIIDLGHILNALGIDDPEELVELSYQMYGQDTIALSQGRTNYEIVADEAIAAALRLRRDR